LDLKRFEIRLDRTLQVVEVHVIRIEVPSRAVPLARKAQGQHAPLKRPPALAGQMDPADLKQPQVEAPLTVVARDRLEHPTEQGRS